MVVYRDLYNGIYLLVMTNIAVENHNLWENPLFLWPFSIAMLIYQRLDHTTATFSFNEPPWLVNESLSEPCIRKLTMEDIPSGDLT